MYSVMLSFTVLRGQAEPDFILPPTPFSDGLQGPISPLYVPQQDFSLLYGKCSMDTFEIIKDMHSLTMLTLSRSSYGNVIQPSGPGRDGQDPQFQHIYNRHMQRPSTKDLFTSDYIYESCRLAGIIYCASLVHEAPFADSANMLHACDDVGLGFEHVTTISLLQDAVSRTDTSHSWGNELRGVFLWVCLVGGAASWSNSRLSSSESLAPVPVNAWARKFFALNAVRASVSVPFEHADSMIQALRNMQHIRQWLTREAHSA